METESTPTSSRPRWIAAVADHPVITGVFLGCIVLGAVLGVQLLAQDWSLARRIAGGVVAGAGVALCITAPRIVG